VIVNYRTPALVVDCLHSLAAEISAMHGAASVWVVDNASGDDSVVRLRTAIDASGWAPWANLLPLRHNGGFAQGCNAAIRVAATTTGASEYVLLLNPDTVVLPRALAALVEFMDQHREVGIAGSRLEHRNGEPQVSAFRFPSVLSELENGVRLGLVTRLLRRHKVAVDIPPTDEPVPADWVAGASMMVRRTVFDRVGLLDERYFLYFEETDFCRRARSAGWPCWYVPRSRVVHLVGQSTGVTDRARASQRLPQYWFDSRRRYFLDHLGFLATVVADTCWAVGFGLYRVRQALLRKANTTTPRLLFRDFVRYNFLGVRAAPADARTPRNEPQLVVRSADKPSPPRNIGDHDRNPPGIGFFALLREDLRTHGGDPFEQGFWAVAVHRFGNWRMRVRPRLLRVPFSLAYRVMFKMVEWTCGITLPYTVVVGRRLRIWHHGGMILIARSIGNDVHIRQNTTFGVARRSALFQLPTIEDACDIACGVAVLGDVTIGRGSVIGANAVVVHDVPPFSVAVGAPARVIKSADRPTNGESASRQPVDQAALGELGMRSSCESRSVATRRDAKTSG
jgi:GT2 family glycosyltransferase/serine acetyltransferase